MTRERDELNVEVPEGDYADQLIPADPADDEETPAGKLDSAQLANEADWVEQQKVVPLDQEDHEGEGATDE